MTEAVASVSDLAEWRRGRRLALKARRQKADASLCYRCRGSREYLYPLQLPGYMFPYEGQSAGAATDIRICADCLRNVCGLLGKWVLSR